MTAIEELVEALGDLIRQTVEVEGYEDGAPLTERERLARTEETVAEKIRDVLTRPSVEALTDEELMGEALRRGLVE